MFDTNPFLPPRKDYGLIGKRCPDCNSVPKLMKVSRYNPNGNAGRAFCRCDSCDKFLAFLDDEGCDPENPECYCGKPSRLQRAGRGKKTEGGLHFVCKWAKLGCDFYEVYESAKTGEQVVIPEHFIDLFKKNMKCETVKKGEQVVDPDDFVDLFKKNMKL